MIFCALIDTCLPGYYNDVSNLNCVECGFGFFQNLNNGLVCYECPEGETTPSPTATQATQCSGKSVLNFNTGFFTTLRMRIRHVASVMFLLCLSFLFTGGGGGVVAPDMSTFWLSTSPGMNTFWLKIHPPEGMSTFWLSIPPGMSTFWLNSAKYANRYLNCLIVSTSKYSDVLAQSKVTEMSKFTSPRHPLLYIEIQEGYRGGKPNGGPRYCDHFSHQISIQAKKGGVRRISIVLFSPSLLDIVGRSSFF